MTHKVSRGKGDIGAKQGFMRHKLAQYHLLEDVAIFATTTLHSLVPADKIALAVIEGDTLKSVAAIGPRVFMDLRLDWPSINARAVKTMQTQLVNDTREDPDYFPGEGRDAVTMLSELCVPMIYQDEVLGTINLECREADRFTEEDRRAVEALAREVAVAVHRVHGNPAEGESGGGCGAKNRSTVDNYYGILVAVYDGETVLNRIVHRVALPWKRGKEMVSNLVAKGYLCREKKSAARYVYKITERGVEALKTYDDMTEKLGT